MALVYVALEALFMLIFLEIKLVDGQSDQVSKMIIANSDPQIIYSPSVCSSMCPGAWWDTNLPNGSAIKTTIGPSSGYNNAQTTLSYSFYGSSLEVYGFADTDGANAIIQVDNFLVIVNTSTGDGGASMLPHILHNSSQLDPQAVHTLSIGWSAAGGNKSISYVYFDHLVIGNFRAVNFASTASLSSATSSATAATPSTEVTSAKLKPGALAGIIISVLSVVLLFTLALYFLCRNRYHPFRRRRQPSPHTSLMIESQQSSDAITVSPPTQRESWKAHPHMSLPPAYGRAYTGRSEKAGYNAEKGDSYLDLESGSTKSLSTVSSPGDMSSEKGERKSRILLLAASLESLRSPRVSSSARPKLELNTRESVLSPQAHPFSGYANDRTQGGRESSPVTPFTPYYVGMATRTRPQNAQFVRKSLVTKGKLSAAGQVSTTPLPPLPALPPIQNAHEEKRHLGKQFDSSERSHKTTRAHTLEEVDVDKEGDGDSQQYPNGLEININTSSNQGRPSFDAMSVMTRSVPPPYTPHV